MRKKQLHECPVCGSGLRITAYECPECRTRIEGNFIPEEHRFSHLSDEDLLFIEQFVRVRGSIKEMEKVLGVSYPTVRSRLNSVIEQLGYPAEAAEQELQRELRRNSVTREQKRDILVQVEKGEISADQAVRMLKGESVQEQGESARNQDQNQAGGSQPDHSADADDGKTITGGETDD